LDDLNLNIIDYMVDAPVNFVDEWEALGDSSEATSGTLDYSATLNLQGLF